MISSHPEWADYKEAPISGSWFKKWLKTRFRYVDYPFLLAYRGYGNSKTLVLQGHVFKGMALTRPRNRYTTWQNFVSLIKMFLVRTVPEARVELKVGNDKVEAVANETGFFEFKLDHHDLEVGWNKVELRLDDELVEGQEEVNVKIDVLIEQDFEYGCISDIDDTFLVSHVTKVWKKLYLLLTKNPESRKPVKGVVDFYKSLQNGVTDRRNPFFYVSSSEWNLYDFLIKFIKFHKLPKGVLQLKEIKDNFTDFFKSGFGSHDHKRVKIERIFEMYPDHKFILLGDNGQHDPYIYHRLTEEHGDQIKAIYIRAVKKSNNDKVNELLQKIDETDIPSLQFKNSAEAVAHAKEHGFIQ